MGTMIYLSVGRLEIDWGKNFGFTDHSALFQGDLDVAFVPYYYAEEDENNELETDSEVVVEFKEGLSKPLYQVVDRLNLLGHTYDQCEKEFSFLSNLNRFNQDNFRFRDLCDILEKVDVKNISANYGEGGEDFGKFFRREIAPRIGLQERLIADPMELYAVSEGMENLSAYTILHILCNNPACKDVLVQWSFNDLEQSGYERREYFVRGLDQNNRFLIVTEGSSDAAILRKAFSILRPHVADFFDFVDMEEGYPFPGTGNVFRFVQGLIGISVQNKVLVLFDNDVEGVVNYERCLGLKKIPNICILKLPDLTNFKSFQTIGPSGQHTADINGCGAAIECYLDLGVSGRVRWTSYNAKADAYQGELEGKTRYMRDFLDQRSYQSSYDYSGLNAVLDAITASAIKMRESEVERNWEHAT